MTLPDTYELVWEGDAALTPKDPQGPRVRASVWLERETGALALNITSDNTAIRSLLKQPAIKQEAYMSALSEALRSKCGWKRKVIPKPYQQHVESSSQVKGTLQLKDPSKLKDVVIEGVDLEVVTP